MESYGQSKIANILFSVGLTKRFAKEGIFSNSVMPGGIVTNLQRHISKEEQVKMGWMNEDGTLNPYFKNPDQGASTTVWAAVGKEFENVGGLYLEDCAIAKCKSKEDALKELSGYADYSVKPEFADKLWEMSEHWLAHPPKN